MEMTQEEKAMVEAVRNDPGIGRGTCSSVDECMDDSDLVHEIREYKLATPEAAVAHFRGGESLWRKVANDAVLAGGEDAVKANGLWPDLD